MFNLVGTIATDEGKYKYGEVEVDKNRSLVPGTFEMSKRFLDDLDFRWPLGELRGEERKVDIRPSNYAIIRMCYE